VVNITTGGSGAGGYFAPRAACYEKRFKVCVAWEQTIIGASYSAAVWRARRTPVPHYWDT